MYELSEEEIILLLDELLKIRNCEYIILDFEFKVNKKVLEVFDKVKYLILVSDGSEISNIKTIRGYKALEIFEKNLDLRISSKMSLLYNKFSEKNGRLIEGLDLENIGGINRIANATSEIVEEISKNESLADLIRRI